MDVKEEENKKKLSRNFYDKQNYWKKKKSC